MIDHVPCPECGGAGEVRHPRWGARNCPEPTIECPVCHGHCEVLAEVRRVASCPRCADTKLRFNPRPWSHYDEGDLFVCGNCGLNGESADLIEIMLCPCEGCDAEVVFNEQDSQWVHAGDDDTDHYAYPRKANNQC